MKHFSYSFKISLAVLNIVFVLLFAISTMFTMGNITQIQSVMGNSQTTRIPFGESKILQQELEIQASDIKYFLEIKNLFEEEEKFTQDKSVDAFKLFSIMENRKQINQNMMYTVKELVRFSGILQGLHQRGEEPASGEEFVIFARDKGLLSTNDKEIAPEGYSSIEEFAKKNNYAVWHCYRAWFVVLSEIRNTLDFYQYNVDYFSNENTNIYYEVSSLDGRLLSASGHHPKNLSPGFTIRTSDFVLKVAVNLDLPSEDRIKNIANVYNHLNPYSRWIWAGIVVGLLGALITVTFMMLATGHKRWGDKLRTNTLDKIKTELFFAVISTLIFLLLKRERVHWEEYFFSFRSYEFLVICGYTVVIVLLAQIGLLSFVRRLRVGNLYENSLLIILSKALANAIENSREVYVVLGMFFMYLLVTIGAFFGGIYGILVWILVNVFVLYRLIKICEFRRTILEELERMIGGEVNAKIDISKMIGYNKKVAKGINRIGHGLSKAMEHSLRDERLKTDLITNVSHDIKNPLTSIINYIYLLKQENINNERVGNYISVLDRKAQQLKNLTDDLVEASKISSGNITLEMADFDFKELYMQIQGDFEEKFNEKELTVVVSQPQQAVMIHADGKRMWRVVSNLLQNVYKYAMPNTRVYVELIKHKGNMEFSIKNISKNALNIDASELTERFIRGDISRSTEGSGLGLSIAKNLTNLQMGEFDIHVDGDLFKVTLKFDLVSVG